MAAEPAKPCVQACRGQRGKREAANSTQTDAPNPTPTSIEQEEQVPPTTHPPPPTTQHPSEVVAKSEETCVKGPGDPLGQRENANSILTDAPSLEQKVIGRKKKVQRSGAPEITERNCGTDMAAKTPQICAQVQSDPLSQRGTANSTLNDTPCSKPKSIERKEQFQCSASSANPKRRHPEIRPNSARQRCAPRSSRSSDNVAAKSMHSRVSKRMSKTGKEEQSVLLERIYKALDSSGDGTISCDEVAACLAIVDQSAEVGVASDDIRKFFDFLNADSDGLITRKEWDDSAKNWFERNGSTPLSKYLLSLASYITQDKIGSKIASIKGEKLSLKEWDNVKSDAEDSDLEEQDQKQMLIALVINADGAIPTGQELYLELTDQVIHARVTNFKEARAYPHALSLPDRGKKLCWCIIDLYEARIMCPMLSKIKLPFTLHQPSSVTQDVERLLDALKTPLPLNLHHDEIFGLVSNALQIIKSDPCLIRIGERAAQDVSVFGDIHGNFDGMIKLLAAVGAPSPTKILLCLGDYVDRGNESLRVILYLLALKVKYPNRVYLLRGNHEDGHMNARYGFEQECCSVYRGPAGGAVYRSINNLFCYLPLAAVIDFAGVFCCHGGIGPSTQSLAAIAGLRSYLPCGLDMHNPEEQASMVKDLLWADPARQDTPADGVGEDGFAENKNRGMSYHFGPQATEKFLSANKLSMILRGHEVAQKGFEVSHDGRVMTLFSSPGYQNGNSGASFTFVPGARNITVFVIDESLRVFQTHRAEKVQKICCRRRARGFDDSGQPCPSLNIPQVEE